MGLLAGGQPSLTRIAGRLAGRPLIALATCAAVIAAMAPHAPAQESHRVRLPVGRETALTPTEFTSAYQLLTLVYDTLYWRDGDGAPQPWLARGATADDDLTRYEIELRHGARWQDGTPLTARDVAFTFDFFRERFHPRFTPQLEVIEDVEVRDRDSLAVTLSRAAPGFLDQPLSDVPILPRHLWEGLPQEQAAPAGLPVGSGPYRVVRSDGGGFTLRSVDDYFLGAPTVSQIEVPFIDDYEESVEALVGGSIDMLPIGLTPGAAEEAAGSDVVTETVPSYTGTALVFNLRQPPFDDLGAREAVAAALDVDSIARLVEERAGRVDIASAGWLHPQSRWAPAASGSADLDPEGAGPVLESLGEVTLLASRSDPVKVVAAREVAATLDRAGAAVRPELVPPDAVAQATGESGAEPTFELALVSTPPLASYDPDFLRVMFGSGPEAALNVSGYASPEFDAAAERVASTTDEDARLDAVAAEQDVLAGDLPGIPILFPLSEYGYRPDAYDGWVGVTGTGILDKRSFLPADLSEQASEPDAQSAGDGSGFPLLGAIAALLVIAAVVVALHALRRRS